MKRKTLKKALAGISAVAMLGTALPVSLIADAYSYTNLGALNQTDLLKGLQTVIKADTEQDGGYKVGSVKNPLAGAPTEITFSIGDAAAVDLASYNFTKYARYQVNEEFATVSASDSTPVKETVISADWDTEQAIADIIASSEDIKAVTLYDKPDDAEYGSATYGRTKVPGTKGDRYGKIKTITLSMPVNVRGGKGGIDDIIYDDIEFTVVYNIDDIIASYSNNDYNEARHIILAGRFTGGVDGNDLDISTGNSIASTAISTAEGTSGTTLYTLKDNLNTAKDNVTNASTGAKKALTDAVTVVKDKVTAIKDAIDAVSYSGDGTNRYNNVNEVEGYSAAIAAINAAKNQLDAITSAVGAADEYTNTAIAAAITGMTSPTNLLTAVVTTAGTLGTNCNAEKAATGDAIISAKSDAAITMTAITAANNTTDTGLKDKQAAAAAAKADYDAEVARITAANSLIAQIAYAGDIDINLNGKTLTTESGLQVNGRKMRVWNGTITSADALATKVSTLNAYGTGSSIELYDNVTVKNLDSSSTKGVISGEGKLVMCGDGVHVQHANNGNKALDVKTFEKGDYIYDVNNTGSAGNGTFGENTDDPNAASVSVFDSQKIHNYNKYGFEVRDRSENFEDSENYLDVDVRTEGYQYGYQPATANGSALNNTYNVDNLGKLFWAAQQINKFDHAFATRFDTNQSSNSLTINIKSNLDFKDAPVTAGKQLIWTPVDSSKMFTLNVDGAYQASGKQCYSVLSNMTVEAANGNGGLFAKTGKGEIKNIGLENASVTAAKGTAAVLVGEANGTEIRYAYVKTPKKISGLYEGAMAGLLKDGKIDHTYVAAEKVAAIYSVAGSTASYLAKDGVKTTEGYTNFYDSDLENGESSEAKGGTGHTELYLMPATTDDFKEGRVAFMLNEHNPEQVEDTPVSWGDNTNSGTYSIAYPTVAHKPYYDGTYLADVFGQTLGTNGEDYPTFIKGGATGTTIGATNKVYRVIVSTCKGDTEAWTKTNATFSNKELDPTKSGHTDANKDDECDACHAYKITTTNFDASMIPYLSSAAVDSDSSKTPAEDGWLNRAEIHAITKVEFDLTKAETTKKIVDIVNEINDADAEKQLKGLSILNHTSSDGTSWTAAPGHISVFTFVVNDKVICRSVDASADEIKRGQLVASGFASASKFAQQSTASMWNDVETKVNAAVNKSTMNSTSNTADNTKYDFYVTADQNTGTKKAYASASFKEGTRKYYVIFKGGVLHNDKEDKKPNGAWDIDSTQPYSPTGTQKVKVYLDAQHKSTHTYVGVNCGCEILKEECLGVATNITITQHELACSVCGSKTSGGSDYSAAAQNHDFEIVFTSGSVSFVRCMGCGYCKITKDANIVANEPSIVKLKEGENKFRQEYTFNIAAGDKQIISYGVIYSKDGSTFDKPRAGAGLDAGENGLKASYTSGKNFTAKKTITTSGTYKITASLPTAEDIFTVCGYVVYKDGANYKVASTSVMANSFSDIAVAEMENKCSINEEAVTTSSAKPGKNILNFVMELDDTSSLVSYGIIYDKTGAAIAADTTYKDAIASSTDDIQVSDRRNVAGFSSTLKAVRYQPTFTTGDTNIKYRGYLIVKDEYGIEHTLYTALATNT